MYKLVKRYTSLFISILLHSYHAIVDRVELFMCFELHFNDKYLIV